MLFSKQDFEETLSEFYFKSVGLISGEEAYLININPQARIKIRSSIDKTGYAASLGLNSIRVWLEVKKPKAWASLKKKKNYIQRVPGWDERLTNLIYELKEKGEKIICAPEAWSCGHFVFVGFVEKPTKNQGRPFASCLTCKDKFMWLDIQPKQTNNSVTSLADVNFSTPLTLTWSTEQQNIFDFVENNTRHAVVYGVAGCGKTTTNLEALNRLNRDDTILVAFNRHIAQEINNRQPGTARTLHSLGNQQIKEQYSNAQFDKNKSYRIIKEFFGHEELANDISQIISRLKGNMLEPICSEIDNLADIINADGSREELISKTQEVWKSSYDDMSSYDYDDMISWIAQKRVNPPQFNTIFADEVQDFNPAQITMTELMSNRLILIGDQYQAIYAFRGAFVGIMDAMTNILNATQLPLTTSYRAPLAIAQLVNEKYPEIDFHSSSDAKDGEIVNLPEWELEDTIQAGDGILCRVNAPLVSLCYSLIRRGIKASVRGRDIGKNLISLIDRIAKKEQCHSLQELTKALRDYQYVETLKLEAKNKQQLIISLNDKINTILSIASNCDTILGLSQRITAVFDDGKKDVVLSTVHKAKGLEWNRVFIIQPNLMPHPLATSETDQQQERNIQYVADTRTLDQLFIVE